MALFGRSARETEASFRNPGILYQGVVLHSSSNIRDGETTDILGPGTYGKSLLKDSRGKDLSAIELNTTLPRRRLSFNSRATRPAPHTFGSDRRLSVAHKAVLYNGTWLPASVHSQQIERDRRKETNRVRRDPPGLAVAVFRSTHPQPVDSSFIKPTFNAKAPIAVDTWYKATSLRVPAHTGARHMTQVLSATPGTQSFNMTMERSPQPDLPATQDYAEGSQEASAQLVPAASATTASPAPFDMAASSVSARSTRSVRSIRRPATPVSVRPITAPKRTATASTSSPTDQAQLVEEHFFGRTRSPSPRRTAPPEATNSHRAPHTRSPAHRPPIPSAAATSGGSTSLELAAVSDVKPCTQSATPARPTAHPSLDPWRSSTPSARPPRSQKLSRYSTAGTSASVALTAHSMTSYGGTSMAAPVGYRQARNTRIVLPSHSPEPGEPVFYYDPPAPRIRPSPKPQQRYPASGSRLRRNSTTDLSQLRAGLADGRDSASAPLVADLSRLFESWGVQT